MDKLRSYDNHRSMPKARYGYGEGQAAQAVALAAPGRSKRNSRRNQQTAMSPMKPMQTSRRKQPWEPMPGSDLDTIIESTSQEPSQAKNRVALMTGSDTPTPPMDDGAASPSSRCAKLQHRRSARMGRAVSPLSSPFSLASQRRRSTRKRSRRPSAGPDTVVIVDEGESDDDVVSDALATQYPKDTTGAVSVYESDLERLKEGEFLNDTLIDFYIKYLHYELLGKCGVDVDRFHMFNTFFWKKVLRKGDKSSALKWSANVELFEKDFLFIPVNANLHWYLCIICHPNNIGRNHEPHERPCIAILDSLNAPKGHRQRQVCFTFLKRAWEQKTDGNSRGNFPLLQKNFPIVLVTPPQQQNFCDCGIFLLHYIEMWCIKMPNIRLSEAKGSCPNWFSIKDIPLKRKFIRATLLALRNNNVLPVRPASIESPKSCRAKRAERRHMRSRSEIIAVDDEDDVVEQRTRDADPRRSPSSTDPSRVALPESEPCMSTPLSPSFGDDDCGEEEDVVGNAQEVKGEESYVGERGRKRRRRGGRGREEDAEGKQLEQQATRAALDCSPSPDNASTEAGDDDTEEPLPGFQAARPSGQQWIQSRSVVNWGIHFVPQQTCYVVERMGRYTTTLEPGLNFLVPILDQVSYVQSLKVRVVPIPNQTGITRDNVSIHVGGVLFYQVVDPKLASYAIDDHEAAIKQLAMSTMRVELGKLNLEETFQERAQINERIISSINSTIEEWGDISPPPGIQEAMEYQAVAERRKRQQIIESEGDRQSEINVAEGQRAATELHATAQANSVRILAEALRSTTSESAVSMRLAEQFLAAWSQLAKKGTTVLLPSNVGDPASMVAQALSIFRSMGGAASSTSHGSDEASGLGSSGSPSPGQHEGTVPGTSVNETLDSVLERSYPAEESTSATADYAETDALGDAGSTSDKDASFAASNPDSRGGDRDAQLSDEEVMRLFKQQQRQQHSGY